MGWAFFKKTGFSEPRQKLLNGINKITLRGGQEVHIIVTTCDVGAGEKDLTGMMLPPEYAIACRLSGLQIL